LPADAVDADLHAFAWCPRVAADPGWPDLAKDCPGRIRGGFGYDMECGVEHLTRTVLEALRSHTTEGEWEDIHFGVPRDLVGVLPSLATGSSPAA
jgi:hypothetical protein